MYVAPNGMYRVCDQCGNAERILHDDDLAINPEQPSVIFVSIDHNSLVTALQDDLPDDQFRFF